MKAQIGLLLVLFTACAPPKTMLHPSKFPSLNDPFILPKDPSHHLIDHGGYVLGGNCSMGNIDWTIGVNDVNKIIYFETLDNNFETPEGLSMRSTLKDVIKKGGTPPKLEFGSVYKSCLPSGWYVAFVFGRGVESEMVPTSEHPSWFCKQINGIK